MTKRIGTRTDRSMDRVPVAGARDWGEADDFDDKPDFRAISVYTLFILIRHPRSMGGRSSSRRIGDAMRGGRKRLRLVVTIKGELEANALHRKLEQVDGTYALREPGETYNSHFAVKNEALRFKNALLWNTIA